MATLKRKRKGRHSPAGAAYLKRKKKEKTESVYFKPIKRKSARTRFKEAKLTEQDMAALGFKKK